MTNSAKPNQTKPNQTKPNQTKMTKTILTERTENLLLTAKMPEAGFQVPDDHAIFDQNQRALTEKYKALFGCSEAKSTFKSSVDRDGKRVVYSPSVVLHNGKAAIDWGGEFFNVSEDLEFSGSRCVLVAEEGDDEYTLPVRLRSIKKEDAKTDLEVKYASCKPEEKADFLAKLWKKGNITELLGGFTPALKLSAVIGTNDVVAYRLNKFDAYELQLADGRWVRSNSQLKEKIETYIELGVVVSREQPARLTVEASTRNTAQNHPIYPAHLVSFQNLDLPIFDFSSPAVDSDLTPV